MNKQIMKQAGFAKEIELVEQNKCPLCKEVIRLKEFENELSLREYKISGLCQECQNKVFGKDK